MHLIQVVTTTAITVVVCVTAFDHAESVTWPQDQLQPY